MRLLFEKRLIVLFLVIILWIIGAGIQAFLFNKSINNNMRILDHSHQVQFQSESVFSLIQDVVLSSRGYVISGDSVFLQPHYNALKNISDQLSKLESLLEGDLDQLILMDTLKYLIEKRIIHANEIIQLINSVGFDGAKAAVLTGKGKFYLEEIRTLIERMQLVENKVIKNRNETYMESREKFNLAFYALIAGIIILIIIAAFNIRKNSESRKKAAEQLREYRYFFENSNDLTCIANVGGYFEIINPNFEKVLGYSEKELLENQFLNFVHPDDLDSTLIEVEKLKSGALTIGFLNRYRKKDGTYILLDWNSTPDPLTGKLYAIARVSKEKKN